MSSIDPILSIAEAVGPSGQMNATDFGSDMIALAEGLARARGLRNIEFRIANVESLAFPNESVSARWVGPPGRYWQQFTEVAAPLGSLIAKLMGDTRVRTEAEILAELRKLSDGSAIAMPLKSVISTGIRT